MPKLKPRQHQPHNRRSHEEHFGNLFERHVNFRQRVIYLNKDVEDDSLDLIQKALDELERLPDLPVRIEISSYGGEVYSMFGIVDRIRSSPCHIITRAFGKCMSAATFILAAGDERIMGASAWWMTHQVSDLVKGSLNELKVELKHTNDLENQMNKLYEVLSNGKTRAKTFEKLSQNTCYLKPEKVLELGLIDKVLYL